MVKGATFADREAARRQLTCDNRADHYQHLMTVARWQEQSPRKALGHACDFLRAVAKHMTDDDVYTLAERITRIADERNKP